MGNCLPWGRSKNNLNVSLLIVGLDNAGKTTIAHRFRGVSLKTVAPTVGFSPETFKFGKFNITLIDLGGGKRIRDIWKNYYAEVHGLIYVVDSSDHERDVESKEELLQLVSNHLIKEKPLLVLANKQDKTGAMTEGEVCDYLNLEEVVNDNRCICKVELCAATVQHRKDHTLHNGLTWLLQQVTAKYDTLTTRVQKDIEEREAQIEEERAARAERVRIRREERAKLESEQAASDAQNTNPEVVTNNDTVMTNNGVNEVTIPQHPSANGGTTKIDSIFNNPAVKPIQSGLGDELLDDEEVSLPGSAQSQRTFLGEDSGTESSSRSNKLKEIVRDAPSLPATPTAEAVASLSDRDETGSAQGRKRSKRSNKITPLPQHPHATMLAPIKPKGKLSPLGSPESLLGIQGQDGDSAKLNFDPLPPLKLNKPNEESDGDVIV